MHSIEIKLSDLCELFDEKALSDLVVEAFYIESPLIYRPLFSAEYEEVLKLISAKISDSDLKQAGPNFRTNWSANWDESLINFKKSHSEKDLIPKFIPLSEVLRFKGQYVLPLVPDLEMRLVRILRVYLFEKYLSQVDSLHEFGAGSGFNLVHFGKIYPEKKIYGYDWVNSSVELISLAGKQKNLEINSHLFDMFNPDYSLPISSRSGLLTVGALEQLGKKWSDFLKYMISKRFSIYINVETIYENYLGTNNLYGEIAKSYIEKRNWLQGYFEELKRLDRAGVIEILEQRVIVGSKFHDSWSYTVWKLADVQE